MDAGEAGRVDFTVTVKKQEVVSAVLPMQEHWLPLSNLDLLLPPLDVGVFFCYKKPYTFFNPHSMSFGSMAGSLKKALAQALVSYYAFAGEVVTNCLGEPELHCNNRGVDFVEACADIELHDINLYNPDDAIEGKFLPKKKHGVLAVQLTELKCGGLVVACTFDHRIADAYSTNMFLVAWAEIANPTETDRGSNRVELQPCFRRSLLSPRRPICIDSSFDDMYIPVSMLPPPKVPLASSDHLISRIYYIKAEQLELMQSLASSNGKRTKLESFSAFLWKMIARSSSATNMTAKMGIVVDGRTRLEDNQLRNNPSEEALGMASYFGNVLSIPFGAKPVHELIDKPLSWVADQVQSLLQIAVTEEHFLGLIDWVEAHRPIPCMAKIYANGNGDGPAFVVSSGQRFPGSKIDFGRGKTCFASYHFPWGGDAGYVMPMPSPTGNGDWVVYMHLLSGQIALIESEANHVFKPLTWDYLN